MDTLLNTLVVKKIATKITCLSALHCEGCDFSYASFLDHTCYSTPWSNQVLLFYKQALEQLEIESLDSSELYAQVLENGPSYH
jgi:hypothetical protein